MSINVILNRHFRDLLKAGIGAVVSSSVLAQTALPTSLNEVVVTGYRPGDATATSKTDIPVLENAQAISVVTGQMLEEQGITRLADALRNVAGVSRSSTYGFFDAYQIRGYDAAYGSVFLDGLKNGNVAGESHELGGLEQVEVIKGPASGLFGAAPLGGIVNLVSKRPRNTDFLEIEAGLGSFNDRNISIDANARLNNAGNVYGRLNLVHKDRDEFVDFSHAQRFYAAPSLTWDIAADTQITFLARYQRDLTNPWSPVPAYGTLLSNAGGKLPLEYSVNDDNELAEYNQYSAQAGYVLEHRFSETARVSQNLRFERSKDDWQRWLFASGVSDDQSVVGRYVYGPFRQTTEDLGVDTRLNMDMRTGSFRHTLLVGIDYSRSRGSNHSEGLFDASFNPISLFNPDYSAPLYTAPDSVSDTRSRSEQTGFYLQDHVGFGERFTLTLGGRWDTTETDDQKDEAFSPTFGATWELTPAASLYANVARSFSPTPSWQTRFDGSLLPPETGRNLEGGLKVVSRSANLAGMISIFQLTRMNVATDDPEHLFFYIVTGEQRSRGVEIEGSWAPAPAWDLKAAYAYITAEITKDNTYPVGTPLPNVPKHNLNLWGKYTVQEGPLANLGISVGMLYNSDKHFYEAGLYTLPGYTLLDGGLSYRIGRWTAQFNINNLLDRRHYPDACCLDRVTPGEPRNWRLTLATSF